MRGGPTPTRPSVRGATPARPPRATPTLPPVPLRLTPAVTSAMILSLTLTLTVNLSLTVAAWRAGRGCAAPAVRVTVPAGRERPPSRLHAPPGLRPSVRPFVKRKT